MKMVAEEETIDLYPLFFNEVFGKRLQYFAMLKSAEPVGFSV